LDLTFLTIAGRGFGFADTWTAPPPMMAPPHVQAHNFARAILTDIPNTPFRAGKLRVEKASRRNHARQLV
jgi:hypothetical protein